MNNYDPLWTMRRDQELRNPYPERPDSDRDYNDKRTSLIFKIIKWMLIVSVLLYLLYAVFVHPVDKLKLGLAIGGSCEIRILVYQGLGMGDATLKIDGNLMSITQGHSGYTAHYEVDDGKLYTYVKDHKGEWQRKEADDDLSLSSDGNSGDDFVALLDRRNYERVEGEFFAWRIKDGVDTGGFEKVELRRRNGKFTMTGKLDGIYFQMIFSRIGTTWIDVPWDDKK